jgi:ribonuclease BN (tRNA processing enzyme)
MEITIIGSGTGEPSLKRSGPAVLLKVGKRNVLIDSGFGTLTRLLREGVTYLDIDEIFYTHLHCDHVSDLAPMLFAMRNMARPREKKLVVFGPHGIKRYYTGLLDLYHPTLEPEGYEVSVIELCRDDIAEGGLRVSSLPLAHTCPSVGYRFESGGRSFVFSGDTGYCGNIVALGKDADLLVLECSAPDGYGMEGHLTPSLAGRIAREASAKRLLLTHLYSVCDGFDIPGQCRKEFSREIAVASDGMKIRLRGAALGEEGDAGLGCC